MPRVQKWVDLTFWEGRQTKFVGARLFALLSPSDRGMVSQSDRILESTEVHKWV